MHLLIIIDWTYLTFAFLHYVALAFLHPKHDRFQQQLEHSEPEICPALAVSQRFQLTVLDQRMVCARKKAEK
jgi:hypothetical protein